MSRHVAVSKAGRGSNGYQRDAGTVRHAIWLFEDDRPEDIPYSHQEAECGTSPGHRSMGWSQSIEPAENVNCKACLKRMEKTQQAHQAFEVSQAVQALVRREKLMEISTSVRQDEEPLDDAQQRYGRDM